MLTITVTLTSCNSCLDIIMIMLIIDYYIRDTAILSNHTVIKKKILFCVSATWLQYIDITRTQKWKKREIERKELVYSFVFLSFLILIIIIKFFSYSLLLVIAHIFSHMSLSVCLSVCLSACLSIYSIVSACLYITIL